MTNQNAIKMPSASPLIASYDAQVKSGRIKDDSAQREVLAALSTLSHQLTMPVETPSLWGRLLGKQAPSIRGFYIWGNVGRGKSMLMDLFLANTNIDKKRRIHFHAFMQQVHTRMHQLRLEKRDPVVELVKEIAAETRLLCFDELQATDVADASLLFRLFSGLFDAGVTIVSTSNHPPVLLYTGGVQRERFTKFITLIEEKMQVMALSSQADYRQVQIKSLQKVYFTPLGAESDAHIADILQRLCDNQAPVNERISVHGRVNYFKCFNHTIGYFDFYELCGMAIGAADYLALAKRLDTVILINIPVLTPENRNEAKRFVTLIDVLYEHKIKLICTAAATPDKLYIDGDGAFEFQRTVSRLAEMGSRHYLEDYAQVAKR